MNRQAFIGIVRGSILAAPLAVEGEQSRKSYRIGFLVATPSPHLSEAVVGVVQWALTRNSARRQLRAYVFIQEGELNVPPPLGVMTAAPPKGHLEFKNSGQTPAYDLRVIALEPWVDAFPKPAATPTEFLKEFVPTSMLGPGGAAAYPIAMTRS
jgi:hypothetical protein